MEQCAGRPARGPDLGHESDDLIIRTVKPLQQITVRIVGHDHTAADRLTPIGRDILDPNELTPH